MRTVATASDHLRSKVGLALPALDAAASSMRNHPRIAEIYPEYLFRGYCTVRATVPLMEMARDRARALAGEDPVAAAIAPYLTWHVEEERHAHWVLEDLEAIGVPREDVFARTAPGSVAAMVGPQYYWIIHEHPLALFGYMEIMEGYPPTIEQIDELERKTGYPRSAFRTLERHATIDIGHREELREVLDSLSLSERQAALVGLSALETIAAGTTMIRELVAHFD